MDPPLDHTEAAGRMRSRDLPGGVRVVVAVAVAALTLAVVGAAARAQEAVPAPPAAAPPDAAPSPAPGVEAGVVGDTLPLLGGADTLAPADTAAAAADSIESLEQVRGDLEAARERLDEVQRALETIPAEDRPRRSPRGAVLRAFAAPGWGQFYTGHPVRGALYAGSEVGFATLGFLKQGEVNDLKSEQTSARLAFIAEQQAANPDTVFTLADSLALFNAFDRTQAGAVIQGRLEAAREQREDYFTYAIFSVLFAAVDAFVSAHLEPYEDAAPSVARGADGWQLGLRVPLGRPVSGGGGL